MGEPSNSIGNRKIGKNSIGSDKIGKNWIGSDLPIHAAQELVPKDERWLWADREYHNELQASGWFRSLMLLRLTGNL
jgi:hypothetical protein